MKANQYYEPDSKTRIINKEEDVLRLFEKMYPLKLQKLLLYQVNLNPDFFDLSTGLAGSVLQKLVNYRVKTAFVIDPGSIKSERFKELIHEVNQGADYAFFDSRPKAETWLANPE